MLSMFMYLITYDYILHNFRQSSHLISTSSNSQISKQAYNTTQQRVRAGQKYISKYLCRYHFLGFFHCWFFCSSQISKQVYKLRVRAGMDFFLNKIDKHWDNHRSLDQSMNDLKRKLENLNCSMEDAESRMKAELQPRKKPKKEVQLWLGNVERVNGEVQNLEQRVGESSAVLRGFQTGHVLKKIQEVEELLQQGKFQDGLVIDDTRWIGQALLTTTLVGETAKDYLQKIWQSLMDDEVQRIGVCGMGGVGKTTLMKVINNQLLKETNKFDVVIWVTVSKEMSILKLQKDIVRKLNASFPEDDDDEITRAGMLSDLLAQKGRFVIILDDVWEKFSLERVGIPETSNGSKLLLTTRSFDVCRCMGCRVINMKPLAEEDAWNLFLEKLGSDILSYPNLNPHMESIAKHCAGLPLAIITIASSMKGIYGLYEWRNADKELTSRVQSVNGWENEIFHQLQFSYNHLKDPKLQHCFLSCALYPEDAETPEVDLISLWIAEGLVEEMDSRQAEFDRGCSMLNRLINSCLLETVERGSVRYLKMHDLMRDMALRITSVRPRFLVKARLGLTKPPDVQEWSEDLEKVSLVENGRLKIPSEIIPPKCPMLTTLLMSDCAIKSIPERFFQHMPQLKILDLSQNPIGELPSSISDLGNLTRLLLRYCLCLEKVPFLSELGALKELDLEATNIKALPQGIEKLINLSDLNLKGIQNLVEVPNGIVSNFSCLRRLIIGETSISAEEVAGLRKLEIFEGRIDSIHMMGNESILEPLARLKEGPCQFVIYMGIKKRWCEKVRNIGKCAVYSWPSDTYANPIILPFRIENLEIKDCHVDCCEDVSWFTPVPGDRFSYLEKISIVKCRKIKKLFSINWVLKNLRNLRAIIVKDCQQMEEILVSESELEEEGMGSRNTITFTLPSLLIELKLEDLPELKNICSANGVIRYCDGLKTIWIKNCPNLKRIPLHLPLCHGGRPRLPPHLKIWIEPKESWESLEFDDPNTKSLLEPLVCGIGIHELGCQTFSSVKDKEEDEIRKLINKINKMNML